MATSSTSYQFSTYIQENLTKGATFLEKVFTEIKSGYISKADEAGAIADALMKDVVSFAEKAKHYENLAFESGDKTSAKLYSRLSSEFDRLAGERFASSAESYLKKASAMSREKNMGQVSKNQKAW